MEFSFDIKREKAKSLGVRALAHLLPEAKVVADYPLHFGPAHPKEMCNACGAKIANGVKPLLLRDQSAAELPIRATKDRIVSTLGIEKANKTGKKHFEPGLSAEANRNILYIDEINLLDDHLVDFLLDAAAMGVNFLERK